jgi:hypothetical protein
VALTWVHHSGVYHATGTNLTIRRGDNGRDWYLYRGGELQHPPRGSLAEAKAAAELLPPEKTTTK